MTECRIPVSGPSKDQNPDHRLPWGRVTLVSVVPGKHGGVLWPFRFRTNEELDGGKRGSSNLSDQVLALATGKTQQEIAAACSGDREIYGDWLGLSADEIAALEQDGVI